MCPRGHSKKWIAILLIVTLGLVVSTATIWHYYVSSRIAANVFLWKQTLVFGLDNFATATFENGVLYAPSKGNNKVYALNASNGLVIWGHNVRQCDASPCIDENVIYVAECYGPSLEVTESPRAMALNKTTGDEIWHFVEPSGAGWVGSPLVNGDFVYFTTYGDGIYALNKTSGQQLWNVDIGTIVCSVAYDNGIVFVSAFDPPGQYAFNATTGEIVWNANYGASWDSSPVICHGIVIQSTMDEANITSTYLLNETNGQLIHVFQGKGGQSTPLVQDNRIIIPSYRCQIWAFDLTTYEELWHTLELTMGTPSLRRPDLTYCSPAAANGIIYYQSLSGMLYAISETDGSILWSHAMDGFGFGSPSIGNGRLFITNDYALYAFKINCGFGDCPMFCRNSLHQSCI
jgi:outer membrane protein assembly factor BamB